MAISTDIKNKIKANLEALVQNETLKAVIVDDFKGSIFDRDFAGYPTAILTTPAIDGTAETNRDNTRTHLFEIVVVHNRDEIQDATEIEDLIEILLDKFDNDPTLGGKADAGVEPSASTPEAIVDRGKTYIVFSIFVRAKAIKTLTF